MLGNPWFYRQTINKLAAAFMSLFTNVAIGKVDKNGHVVKSVPVPIMYGPRQKWLGRLLGNPDLTKPVGITLPRMSAEMVNLQYSSARKLNSTNQIRTPDGNSMVYVPVPVDINWRLNILTNTTDDANQIIEQIVPFFTPDWTNRVNIAPDMGLEFDMPVSFQNASFIDSYADSEFNERRIYAWQLDFLMQAYILGPTHAAQLIKVINITTTEGQSNSMLLNVEVTPGMTANGVATSNAAQSVSALTINPDDDWGYVVQVTENG